MSGEHLTNQDPRGIYLLAIYMKSFITGCIVYGYFRIKIPGTTASLGLKSVSVSVPMVILRGLCPLPSYWVILTKLKSNRQHPVAAEILLLLFQITTAEEVAPKITPSSPNIRRNVVLGAWQEPCGDDCYCLTTGERSSEKAEDTKMQGATITGC